MAERIADYLAGTLEQWRRERPDADPELLAEAEEVVAALRKGPDPEEVVRLEEAVYAILAESVYSID